MWLVVALSGFFIGALVNIMDKYILDKTIQKTAVFVFYSTAPAIIFLSLIFWTGGLLESLHYVLALLAGAMFVFGLWANYQGIQKSDISHIGPLIGAVIPIFVALWSIIFFKEIFSWQQLSAILFLIFGSLLIAVEKTVSGGNNFGKGVIWAVLGGFLMSIFAVISKYLYDTNNFLSSFVFIQGGMGLVGGMLLVFSKDVRQSFGKKDITQKFGWKKIVFIIATKFLGVLTFVLIQYAVALGSAVIVYALAGVQYALLVIFVFILSRLWPKFYAEEYSKGELLQEFVAVILIGIGLAFLV